MEKRQANQQSRCFALTCNDLLGFAAKVKHFFAHLFRRNKGEVITWWDIDALFVGFQCDDCGKIFDAQMIGVYVYGNGEPKFKWLINHEEA
jgi:hypothetical protein